MERDLHVDLKKKFRHSRPCDLHAVSLHGGYHARKKIADLHADKPRDLSSSSWEAILATLWAACRD